MDSVLDMDVKAELETLKDIIIRTVPVDQILLFGSYAYGIPNKDSDLDLYIVLKDDIDIREFDASVKILSAIGHVKTKPVDIIANKKTKFLKMIKGPTMERKIIRERIKIYG